MVAAGDLSGRRARRLAGRSRTHQSSPSRFGGRLEVLVVLGFETSSAAHVPGAPGRPDGGRWQPGAGGGRDALATSRQGCSETDDWIGLWRKGTLEQTTWDVFSSSVKIFFVEILLI